MEVVSHEQAERGGGKDREAAQDSTTYTQNDGKTTIVITGEAFVITMAVPDESLELGFRAMRNV